MIVRIAAIVTLLALARPATAASAAGGLPAADVRIAIRNRPDNAYFFDDRAEVPCDCEKCRKFPPPVRDCAHPQKLLGANGHAERLTIEHPQDLPVTLELSNPGLASLETQADAGGQTVATLAGLREGESWLWVKAKEQVLGAVKLRCFARRTIKLSYSYVQYPGEPDHPVKRGGKENMAWISALYDQANVGIEWTDNGVLTLEWDLDGDGNSYSKDYKEMWSPLDQRVLPQAEDFFSNLFILRFNKDAAYHGGSNGGGTSRGYGPTDRPPRGAMVRAHLFPGPHQYASTLAHELGHNLGLAHTPHNQPGNLMTIARKDNRLNAEQWAIVHDTLGKLSGELAP